MGCSSSKSIVSEDILNPPRKANAKYMPDDSKDETFEYEEMLKMMQEHNFKRMVEDIQSNIHLFLLNNLLMSIQFWTKFESAQIESNKFRDEKEEQTSKAFSKSMIEGNIFGPRKCKLLSAMGFVLGKSYIYRDPDANESTEIDMETAFLSNSLLPLEYMITWENLKVYGIKDWNRIEKTDPGTTKKIPNLRLFYEEANPKQNKIPRGFIRLRCMDGPKSLLEKDSNGYSSGGNDSRKEKISDVSFEENTSDEETDDFVDGDMLMKQIEQRIASQTKQSKSYPKPVVSINSKSTPDELSQNADSKEKKFKRRDSGFGFEKFQYKPLKQTEQMTVPEINFIPGTPPSEPSMETSFPFANEAKPHASRNSNLGNKIHLRNRDSSGYDSMSLTSNNSRSSSMESEKIRTRWLRLELKSLSLYKSRTARQPFSMSNFGIEPLTKEAFKPVEFDIWDEENATQKKKKRNVSNSDSDEESEVSDSGTVQSKRRDSQELKEIRFYLDSATFSSEFCSEFHIIGPKIGIPIDSIDCSMVLSSLITSAIPFSEIRNISRVSGDKRAEDFMTVINMPSLSLEWPKRALNRFMIRLNHTTNPYYEWLTDMEKSDLESMGINLIPRGLKTFPFFNTHQTLEWEYGFHRAESVLLNSWRTVHWRAYIFSAIVFRAFLVQLGPQGVGLSHVRNILYFLCQESYLQWIEEEPGRHLMIVLQRLYDHLGRKSLPSFFMEEKNLLQSIPKQNANLVQANLKKVIDNPLIFCLFALKNLKYVSQNKTRFPQLNYSKLYKLLVAPERSLLSMINPNLYKDEGGPRDSQGAPRRLSTYSMQFKEFEQEFVDDDAEYDKVRERLRKKHQNHQKKRRKEKERERLRLEEELDHSEIDISKKAPKGAINLKARVIEPEKFSTSRLLLIIKLFIEHFVGMMKVCNSYREYAQSTMYLLHCQNLIRLLKDSRFSMYVEDSTVEEYMKTCDELESVISVERKKYIENRVPKRTNYSKFSFDSDSVDYDLDVMRKSIDYTMRENWNLEHQNKSPSSVKVVTQPSIANTLRSFRRRASTLTERSENEDEISVADIDSENGQEYKKEGSGVTESFKFVELSSASVQNKRISIHISGIQENDREESTDL